MSLHQTMMALGMSVALLSLPVALLGQEDAAPEPPAAPWPPAQLPDGQPDVVTFLYEYAHATRYVYTNGTEHPEGPINWWMGDSRGHWEGDTLVVDVVHFTDQTWFDRTGNFHSENLHVVERYSFVDADHINYEVTIEDPDVFTRPWTMSMVLYRRTEPNFQLLDYDCYGFEWEQYYPYPGL